LEEKKKRECLTVRRRQLEIPLDRRFYSETDRVAERYTGLAAMAFSLGPGGGSQHKVSRFFPSDREIFFLHCCHQHCEAQSHPPGNLNGSQACFAKEVVYCILSTEVFCLYYVTQMLIQLIHPDRGTFPVAYKGINVDGIFNGAFLDIKNPANYVVILSHLPLN
jgi:hypothetical protein